MDKMLYMKIVRKYFPGLDDYTEDRDRRVVSFTLEDKDLQDSPDFSASLREMAHILEPSLITHQTAIREGNAGCGAPECCGYNYNIHKVTIICSDVRFSEEDPNNPNLTIEKLEEIDLI